MKKEFKTMFWDMVVETQEQNWNKLRKVLFIMLSVLLTPYALTVGPIAGIIVSAILTFSSAHLDFKQHSFAECIKATAINSILGYAAMAGVHAGTVYTFEVPEEYWA